MIRYTLLISCLLCSLLITAQADAPDEDTGSYTTCNVDGENATRTSNDLPNPVNVGTIDDRSCYANYKESNVYGKTWGVYNITYNSNNQDAVNTLQPRIERALSPSQKTGVGSYARFTGTVRILETGDTFGTGSDGSYIAQAKGKHTGGGGSADPAICLYLAKPIYGTGANAGKQVSFDIYAERILYRGGSGSGREVVFLKNVIKDAETSFELEIGFRQDPNDANKKIHYCDAVIGGTAFNWNVPEPERGIESKIRYGAYRVKGGRAQIRWANTTYQKMEEDEVVNPDPEPVEAIYKLRNVETGKYLTDAGVSATAVTMSDSGDGQDKLWTFVSSGAFYNIDSESFGILRATGSSPRLVLSTSKAAPAADTDKVWTLHYNESDDIYRFEAGNSGRFLYHDANGSVTNISVADTDDRSKWQAIAETVSLSDDELLPASIKVYPNPVVENFTILLEGVNSAEVNIFNMLGELIYSTKYVGESIELSKSDGFSSGVYLVQISYDRGLITTKKMIIK